MDAKIKNGINKRFPVIFPRFIPEKIPRNVPFSCCFASVPPKSRCKNRDEGGCFAGNSYQVDYTNVFYELVIPDIWITPREVVTNVDGSNVLFTVTGTNIPQGVDWSLIPDLSGSGGASIQSNGAWQAEISPENVGTNYKVRATSVDNTNFYDQVDLTVLGMQSFQYKIGTNAWTNMPDPLYVCKDTTVDFKAIKAPTNAAWPSDKPVWGGLVSGSAVETNSYTFSTISTGATDYKIVSAECGNMVSGRVVVLNVELTTTKGYGLWWFNGEDAENYDESGTLTAQVVTEGTFKWDIVGGATNKVVLYALGEYSNSITLTDNNILTIKSTGASVVENDVTVKFTYNGNEMCQYSLSVRTPKEEIEMNLIHDVWSYMGNTNGYDSKHEFVVIDQLGEDLPATIYWNEHWTESAQNDHTPPTTWPQAEIGSWEWPEYNIDHLYQCRWGTYVPNTTIPQTPLGNEKVFHWNGEHYIGSSTEGHGVKVLMKKWQYYQDHGRRE